MPRLPAFLLLTVQALGLILSLAFVAVTFVQRSQLEDRLMSFAIGKVEVATERALEAAGGLPVPGAKGSALAELAGRMGKAADEKLALRKTLVPALIEKALSERCPGDRCATILLHAVVIDQVLLEQAARLKVGGKTLQDFVVERYDSTIAGLVADLRRFGLVNVVAFTLMIGLVLFRQHLNWRFAALGVAMTGYTAWAMHGYLFRQNWAQTIIFQDWAGPVYQVAMILTCLLFSDWLFLRGFVTRLVVDLVTSVVSSVLG